MSSKSNFKDLLALDPKAIAQEIVKNRCALFQFRMMSREEPVKAHVVRQTRRHIARLKTALSLRALESMGGE